jgi:hypothetical protein
MTKLKQSFLITLYFKESTICHKLKKFPCLIMPMSTKCQKKIEKMTINVIQHDDKL